MKLVASLIVHDELQRYLKPCVEALLDYCDEVRVLDDFSRDGSYEWMLSQHRVSVLSNGGDSFFTHEGNARNSLLEWTLMGDPTHVLAIDADEFCSDGAQVRKMLEANPKQPVWTLSMEEVWKVDAENLWIRGDGGWRAHEIPCLWRVPEQMGSGYVISDRALSCGREPESVREQYRRSARTGEAIFHFGWTQESARADRYQRYVTHDGGEYHANAHIQSIMFPDNRVRLSPRPWPGGLQERKTLLTELVAR